MTAGPGRTARDLLVAADEELAQAAFCTGEFTAAEMAAGNLPRAVELLRRAVPIAQEAALLPWRVADAEQNLRQAEAAAAAEAAART